jgi:hypothetical protein
VCILAFAAAVIFFGLQQNKQIGVLIILHKSNQSNSLLLKFSIDFCDKNYMWSLNIQCILNLIIKISPFIKNTIVVCCLSF